MEVIVTRRVGEDELYHYGVKGMKWGVRKRSENLPVSDTRRRYDEAKANRKAAKKAYNKSFNKAYNYSSTIRLTKKGKAERDRRWEDTYDKLDTLDKAKIDYKKAKVERNQQIRSAYKKVNEASGIGDRLKYNDATRKKAAQYMVDNNMSMGDARKKANKEAIRNTAIILGAYGGVLAATVYKSKH